VSGVDINNNETISGTAFVDDHYRGFRLDTRTGTTTEPEAWALGINSRGDVVGYSFFFGGLERIGVWDRQGNFTTYFVEGTQAFPTVSNSLRINGSNTIVITFLSFHTAPPPYTSYLVPRPGVRLDLRDITSAFPEGYTAPSIVAGINSSGDLMTEECRPRDGVRDGQGVGRRRGALARPSLEGRVGRSRRTPSARDGHGRRAGPADGRLAAHSAYGRLPPPPGSNALSGVIV
jgi:hypothetical protein